jgi:hypothetical protein
MGHVWVKIRPEPPAARTKLDGYPVLPSCVHAAGAAAPALTEQTLSGNRREV